LAKQFGISPNTLRNYETNGFIPPAKRAANGYRMYTNLHAAYLACIQAMAPGFGMDVTSEVLHSLQRNQQDHALWIVRENEVSLYEEKRRLETLMQKIQQYVEENKVFSFKKLLTIHEVSKQTGVRKSTIRYWEKAGLLTVERDPANTYRRYSEAHLFKIRLLQVLQKSVYSEETVALKQSIAALDQNNMAHMMQLAEHVWIYLNRVNESQMKGIYYLYKLLQLIKEDGK
jgi:DNA-binding transcriptional MerR regulator